MTASRALLNARVLPMTNPDAEAQAILWLGDRIAAVGTNDDIRRAAAEAGLDPSAIEDLGGRVVIPGFVDAHLHFQHVGTKALRPWLHGLPTRHDVLGQVRQWLEANPGTSPVVGEGWDESSWPERIMLTRDELDNISRDAPDGAGGTTHRTLVLRRIDGHVAVANSPALAAIRPRWDDDALVNLESGLLLEEPSLYLNEVLPATAEDLDEAIRLACQAAHAEGVTACGDYEQAPSHAALQRAAARGELSVRVGISVYAQQLDEALNRGLRCGRRAMAPDDGPRLPKLGSHDHVWPPAPATNASSNGNQPGAPLPAAGHNPGSDGSSPWLHELGLKLFLDGSLGGNTAYLHQPYMDDPDNRGTRIWTDEQLDDMLWRAHAAGMTIHLHAIGDAAIDQALDAFERLRDRVDATASGDARQAGTSMAHPRWSHNARRHRIEHFELPTPEARRRAADLGIIASVQPNFVGAWSSKGGMYEARLGERFYLNNLYQTFIDEGVALAFGSDGMPFGPRYGIQSAVEHPLEGERLSPQEAVYYYTNRAAWSIHLDGAGTLEPGKWADLVILDLQDLASAPATQWPIHETIAGGVSRGAGDGNATSEPAPQNQPLASS